MTVLSIIFNWQCCNICIMQCMVSLLPVIRLCRGVVIPYAVVRSINSFVSEVFETLFSTDCKFLVLYSCLELGLFHGLLAFLNSSLTSSSDICDCWHILFIMSQFAFICRAAATRRGQQIQYNCLLVIGLCDFSEVERLIDILRASTVFCIICCCHLHLAALNVLLHTT